MVVAEWRNSAWRCESRPRGPGRCVKEKRDVLLGGRGHAAPNLTKKTINLILDLPGLLLRIRHERIAGTTRFAGSLRREQVIGERADLLAQMRQSIAQAAAQPLPFSRREGPGQLKASRAADERAPCSGSYQLSYSNVFHRFRAKETGNKRRASAFLPSVWM